MKNYFKNLYKALIGKSSSGQVDELLVSITEEIKYLDLEYNKWKNDRMDYTASFWCGRLQEARYLGTKISRLKSKGI